MEFNALKDSMRNTWTAGDFGQIARYSSKSAEDFVSRLPLRPGMPVLDVACGTGNTALPAARTGAEVTAVDLAPNLLDQARKRADAEKLSIHFHEGDAEDLPLSDNRFDVVLSMFGAMFAPRPELTAKELIRVCRIGGLVAMANWTPQSFTGKMSRLMGQYVPPPNIPAPTLWGNEATVQQRFGGLASKIETHVRPLEFDYPFPPAQVVQFFRDYFGPMKMAFSRVEPARSSDLQQALEELWSEHNLAGRDSGRTLIHNEYLEVLVTKR